MIRLFFAEIMQEAELPDFGGKFPAHIKQKKHPEVRAASLSAWTLLAQELQEYGHDVLPDILFSDTGKPYFADSVLHFSLSHSGSLAAAVISDAPCAVDLELVRPQVEERLVRRCMSEREIAAGCDFFDVWTKKECIAKLDGRGLPARPSQIDTLDGRYADCFHTQRIYDSFDKEYALCVLSNEAPIIEKRTIG